MMPIQSDTNAATKSDVKDLEIRMLNEFSKTQLQIQAMTREMNQLTFRLLGGMFGIIALFICVICFTYSLVKMLK